MQQVKKLLTYSVPVIAIMVLILDTKTALLGASVGIDLCLKTIIPSLFPFIFLTGYILNSLNEKSIKLLSKLGRISKIPSGAEPIYLLGLLGGYPVGAQAIQSAYNSGSLSQKNAERMLGFCNNAGPAFIFGLIGCLFDSLWIPWIIWFIIIFASFFTSCILPGYPKDSYVLQSRTQINPLENAIKATTKICGWIILFRILITVMDRWIFWLLPTQIKIICVGILELANGFFDLSVIQNPVFRMTYAASMLSFGGICVGMQTMSVLENLNSKIYWLGKLFQISIVIPVSYTIASILYFEIPTTSGIIVSSCACISALSTGYLLRKNNSRNYIGNVI